jgi:glutamine amidotransferase
MGWNTVTPPAQTKLFAGVENERFYFVHSYAVTSWELPDTFERTQAPLVTYAEHGQKFVAAVENGPLVATQFHPEKSGDAGAHLLKTWVEGLK